MMDFSKLRILIVDDQQESRFFLRSVLSDLGVNQVFEAKDGRGALEFMDYGQDLVDIIFCDWNMPALPGIDFLKQIRGAGIDIPFMMITGRCDHESVLLAKSHGVNVYIRKPFSPLQIEAKLRVLLKRLEAA